MSTAPSDRGEVFCVAGWCIATERTRIAWYLVWSLELTPADWPAAWIVATYGQRFTTKECFKDEKNDPDEGFHLDCVMLSTPVRWNRLLLIFDWVYSWLNIAGWVAEVAGKDSEWRANTVKTKRTHALWRLGTWT